MIYIVQIYPCYIIYQVPLCSDREVRQQWDQFCSHSVNIIILIFTIRLSCTSLLEHWCHFSYVEVMSFNKSKSYHSQQRARREVAGQHLTNDILQLFCDKHWARGAPFSLPCVCGFPTNEGCCSADAGVVPARPKGVLSSTNANANAYDPSCCCGAPIVTMTVHLVTTTAIEPILILSSTKHVR